MQCSNGGTERETMSNIIINDEIYDAKNFLQHLRKMKHLQLGRNKETAKHCCEKHYSEAEGD